MPVCQCRARYSDTMTYFACSMYVTADGGNSTLHQLFVDTVFDLFLGLRQHSDELLALLSTTFDTSIINVGSKSHAGGSVGGLDQNAADQDSIIPPPLVNVPFQLLTGEIDAHYLRSKSEAQLPSPPPSSSLGPSGLQFILHPVLEPHMRWWYESLS